MNNKKRDKKENRMDEIALANLAREGNKEALRTLFENNKKRIFYTAYQYVKNIEDAEDIVQDTFIKAYNHMDKFSSQNGTSFSAWLHKIGINCSIDHLRRNKKAKEAKQEVEDPANIPTNSKNSDPEDASRMKEMHEKIEEFLNRLTARQRMIFILKHYQQLSTREIAEYMRCSEGSVKRQLFRAVSTVKMHFRKFFLENNYEMQKI